MKVNKRRKFYQQKSCFDRSSIPDPVQYYSQYFSIPQNRRRVLVPCCFHDDQTPSLSLNLTDGWFNCFGCGAKGGDVLAFHMLKHNMKFIQACKDLGVLR
tara:strand:- start:355 stop:654 length:300 start_codon:yes stop_codon:yes gene_type:complete